MRNLLRTISLIVILVVSNAFAQEAEIQPEVVKKKCIEIAAGNLPTKVTEGTHSGHVKLEYENLRDDKQIQLGYVPAGTIVKIDQSAVIPKKNKHYYAVEIESVARENGTLEKKFSFLNHPKGKLPKVKNGQKGYIWGDSLKPVTDYRFVVTDPALFLSLTNLDLKGKAVEYLKQIKCCEEKNPKQCDYSSVFRIIGKENKEFEVDHCADCEDPMRGLRPIPKKDVAAITSIVESTGIDPKDFEIVTSRGLIEFPYDKETQNGPYCSYHTNPDSPQGIDTYVEPYTGCVFLEVLKQHSEVFLKECTKKKTKDECCKDFRDSGQAVQWGDMAHGYYEFKGEGGWPHATHKGPCIDIRPFKSEEADLMYDKLTWTDKKRYSRDRTKAFIELLSKNGADEIFFNDSDLIRKKLASPAGGHDNHVHFCFNSANMKDSKIPAVQKCIGNEK